MKDFYDSKDGTYFSSVRREILPALPQYSERVLEIGCGSGATLKWLKEEGFCKETTGIELVESHARMAQKNVDNIISADVEQGNIEFPDEYFDLVLCLDVLEHLQNPWSTLEIVVNQWLAPGGVLIASLPNLRYFTVLKDLLVHGKFEYQDVGIMDRTHLRFFTKKSAVSLFQGAGIEDLQLILHPSTVKGKMGIVNAVTFGKIRDVFSWQIIVSGSKPLGT